MKVIKTIQLACGQAYLAETADGQYLELGDVFMSREKALGTRPYAFEDFDRPADTNKRVMTICTMSGCPMNCQFCASRRSFKRKLTADELVGQVQFMVEVGAREHGRDSDPNNAQEFRVLYTRMGEPMLNVDAVIESIYRLIELHPNIIIGMSTSGIGKGIDAFLKHPEIIPHIDMQFSVHSTDNNERNMLFGNMGSRILSIEEIAQYIPMWYALSGNKKVSLNVILFDGYSYDFKGLIGRGFNKDQVWLRLSPWNVIKRDSDKFGGLLKTEDVISKKPVTTEKLKQIIDGIEAAGISYAYAPAIDEEIVNDVACGQALEAFKDEIE
ncbi:hypothetical protein ACFL08_05610 [Patescibacteria group bacterium]